PPAPAVPPAHHSHAVGIGDAPGHQGVDTGEDVAVVASAPVAEVGAAELRPVAAAAADVATQDRVAAARKHRDRIGRGVADEGADEDARGSAVDHDQQ